MDLTRLSKIILFEEINDISKEVISDKIRRTVITDVYSNKDYPTNLPIFLRQLIKNISDLPFFIFIGNVLKNQNKRKDRYNPENLEDTKVYILYVLIDNTSTQNRYKTLNKVIGNEKNWVVLGNPFYVSKRNDINKTISIQLPKYETELNINFQDIGLSNNKIKLSDMSHFYFDEEQNILYVVNVKPISQVLDVKVQGISDSVSYETLFQYQLKFTHQVYKKIPNINFDVVKNGISIKRELLSEFINQVLNTKNSNVELLYLKNTDSDNDYYNLITQFENYFNNTFDDPFIVSFSKELDEFIQNLLVQYNLWKKIDKIDNINKPITIVSENIIYEFINKKIKPNEKEEFVKLLFDYVNTNDEHQKSEILKVLKEKILQKIPNNFLNNKQKLYFLLLSLNKNRISSGDLYIILRNNDDITIENLNNYITYNQQKQVLHVNNLFDYNESSYCSVYPISYKKLESQRLGKFTLKDTSDETENNDRELQLSLKSIFSKITTIPRSIYDEFKKSIDTLLDKIEISNVSEVYNKQNVIISIRNNLLGELKNKNLQNILIQTYSVLSDLENDVLENSVELEPKIKELVNFKNILKQNDVPQIRSIIFEILDNLLYLLFLIKVLKNKFSSSNSIVEQINRLIDNINVLLDWLIKTKITKLIYLNEQSTTLIQDKVTEQVYNQMLSTIYVYIFILSTKNITMQTQLLLEIFNTQLKLNVNIKYHDFNIYYHNSYFITTDFELMSSEHLPYLFSKNFVLDIDFTNESTYSSENLKIVTNSIINVISLQNVYVNYDTSTNTIKESVTDNLNELTELINKVETIKTQDDFKTILDKLSQKISNTSTFNITLKIESPQEINKSIYISFQFRSFQSNLTSEVTNIKIQIH